MWPYDVTGDDYMNNYAMVISTSNGEKGKLFFSYFSHQINTNYEEYLYEEQKYIW